MIAKNAKCPCGSGKQYKRCCIDKPNQNFKLGTSAKISGKKQSYVSSLAICNNHPLDEVLKILALIQLQPQNHGKNIRIEAAVTEVVKSLNEVNTTLDITRLRNDILKDCPKDYREDPPDNFFTENIVFSNGNNIVYPGIFIDVVEILQGHIFTIIGDSGLPDAFVAECKNALILLFNLQKRFPKALQHTYRYFEEIQETALFIPGDEYLLQHKEIFAFNFADIKRVCDDYEIPYTTFDPFVFKWQETTIETEEDPDANPLLSKPFVFVNGMFILTMPTAISHALIQFILLKAEEHKVIPQFVKSFLSSTEAEISSVFGVMGWRPVKMTWPVKTDAPIYMLFDESVWKFDEGKYAYVISFAENILNDMQKAKLHESFSRYIDARISKVSNQLKKEKGASEIMLVTIISKIGLISPTMLGLCKSNINYSFSITPVELFAMTKQWKFNSLTLYKYVKYLSLAEQKVEFAPLTSHLAIFDYYQHKVESFFDSDQEPYNYIVLDFDIAGDIRRKGLLKLDRIGVGYGTPETYGFMQCVRKEEHMPIYVSGEVFYGRISTCLLKYSCPIWIDTSRRLDFTADSYVNTILYWLNEMHEDLRGYIDQLGIIPLSIELSLDEKFYSLQNLTDIHQYDDIDHAIKYTIDIRIRKISFTIPVEMVQFFFGPDNKGERILISFLLDAMGKIIDSFSGKLLSRQEKEDLIDKYIPLGQKKMLLLFTGDKDIKLANVDIPRKRYLVDADISHILENQLDWLGADTLTEKPLASEKEKNEFLNKLVGLHYNRVVEMLKGFDKEKMLIALLRKHESLLQARAFRHVSYPAKVLCYSSYYDVHKEFAKSESDLVETSLAVRVLIEFAVLHPCNNSNTPSEDDIDRMLAHVIQLINYASLSDSIRFGIEDPEIAKLPSGRVGISNEIERTSMRTFRDLIYAEEIHSYTEDFKLYFKRKKRERTQTTEQQRYTEKLNKTFQDEWGITLGEIDMVSHAICSVMIHNQTSVKQITEADFIKWLLDMTDLDQTKIRAYLDRMKFLKRPAPLQPPPGYEAWEVYPWRFNRRLSFLLRPILSFEKNGTEYLLLSARHLLAASENLISLFFNGALKIDRSHKKLTQLLAERNKIKGEEYRNEVMQWLQSNTSLHVFEIEIKIKPKGFFISELDKGDIDILAIDKEKNFVYSIECKNTIQSKLTYDYKMEMDSYLGVEGKEGLIEKHIKRHAWLEANIDQVKDKLSLTETPQIKSMVISKNILPIKHLKPIAMPIISFFEMKSGQFVF